MGWPKYKEDNIDIITNRLSQEKMKRDIILEYEDLKELANSCLLPTENTNRVFKKPKKESSVGKELTFEDKQCVCEDCGQIFLYSASFQKNVYEKGWTTPKRCKKYRAFRKCIRKVIVHSADNGLAFGRGTIVSVYSPEKVITVEFEDGNIRKLDYQMCLDKGFIRFE